MDGTIAEIISLWISDQCWEAPDGTDLMLALEQAAVTIEYATRVYREQDGDYKYTYEPGSRAGHISGDPVRYEFRDGSAIVTAGDAWDIEGAEPFSWGGAE